MSRVDEFVTEKFESLKAGIKKLEAHVESLLGHEDPAVKAISEDMSKTVDSLKADAAHLESVATGDAETVGKDAENAAAPVENLAEQDAAAVAAEVKADAGHAVQAAETADVAPAAASETAADETKPAVGA